MEEEQFTERLLHRLADWLLDNISSCLPDKIYYTAFTRHQEGKETGADWEWWFLMNDGGMCLRVQAKKISKHADAYPQLARTTKHGLQIDMLLSSATKANAIPLYAFYSVVRGKTMCGGNPDEHHDDGVFVAGAHNIFEQLFGRAKSPWNAEDLLLLSNPFSCFACCPLVREDLVGLRDYFSRYYPAETSGAQRGVASASPGFHPQLPSYLTSYLQRLQQTSADTWEQEHASQIKDFNALLVFDLRHNVIRPEES